MSIVFDLNLIDNLCKRINMKIFFFFESTNDIEFDIYKNWKHI